MTTLRNSQKAILVSAAVVLALFIAEVALRIAGARPGVYTLSREFKVVDSLILYKNFTVDESGIYKFSPWVSDSFLRYVDFKTGVPKKSSIYNSVADIDKVDVVYADFLRLAHKECCANWKLRLGDMLSGNTHQSPFKALFDKLKSQAPAEAWDSAIVHYVHHPFNNDGFHSIPFQNDSSKHKKILVIGDSYVYGLSAVPFHASFTDCLLAKGYLVYAAGIPGTDPAQYTAIAKKYIPVIKPDLVVMCFYEGNDYMAFNREAAPDRPIEYLTNAGFFQSAPYGTFMGLEECYTHYKSLITIPATDGLSFNNAMSCTVLGSLFWGMLHKMNVVQHPSVEESKRQLSSMFKHSKPEYTANHINSFNEACKVNGVPVVYTIIPQRDDARQQNAVTVTPDTVKAREVFGDLPFYAPFFLERKAHYGSNDSHFNTAGSLVFAGFLDSLITQHFSGKLTNVAQAQTPPVK